MVAPNQCRSIPEDSINMYHLSSSVEALLQRFFGFGFAASQPLLERGHARGFHEDVNGAEIRDFFQRSDALGVDIQNADLPLTLALVDGFLNEKNNRSQE